MKKQQRHLVLLLLSGALLFFLFTRQTREIEVVDPVAQLMQEDSASTYAIAGYPDSIRKAAFSACSYPSGIIRMQQLQEKTKAMFTDIVLTLGKETQDRVWNITRFDGLAEALVNANRTGTKDYDTIAASYPEEVRVDAVTAGSEDQATLVQLVALDSFTRASFKELITSVPSDLQSSFRTIVRYPELVELLNSNMRLTVMAGDLGKQYPDKIAHQFDSLNIVVANMKAKEAKDWKDGLDKNPDAKNEFVKATKDYMSENNVTEERTTIVNETVVVNYVCHPYSYWYGYPYWWDYPYWYPYPYWYACGYYYSPAGIVFIGYPAPCYMHWYFYGYHHHYYYSHFSDYCIGHYYGHRNVPGGSNRVIGDWIKQEQPGVTPTFFTSSVGRADRLSELGREEINRTEYNVKHPDAPLTRDEYISSTPSSYPSMVAVPANPNDVRNKVPVTKENTVPVNPPVVKPDITPPPPRTVNPPVYKPKQPISQPSRTTPRVPVTVPKANPVPKPR